MPSKINPLKLKASDIRLAMANRWADPEWAIMWEVGQGTGGHAGRYADAVMMSLWPSRGLELHGVEIKISRADWKREAKDPSKAETIARYCDRWWVHTPEGVVDDLSDMPPAWGLREWTGRQWKTIREAEKTDSEPVSRHFLAALLRRADGIMKSMMHEARQSAFQETEEARRKQQEQFLERVKSEVDHRTRDFVALKNQLDKFESAFGQKVETYSPDMHAIGHAASALADASGEWLKNRSQMLRIAAEALDELAAIRSGIKPSAKPTQPAPHQNPAQS